MGSGKIAILSVSLLLVETAGFGGSLNGEPQTSLHRAQGRREVAAATATSRFFIEDRFIIDGIPSKANSVRIWLELPLEDFSQKVSELKIESPLAYHIGKDKLTDNRFLHIRTENVGALPTKQGYPRSGSAKEVQCRQTKDPSDPTCRRQTLQEKILPLEVKVSFVLERSPLAPLLPSPLEGEGGGGGAQKSDQDLDHAFLGALPYVPVDDASRKLARSLAGSEKDTLRQARKIYEFIQGHATYYRTDPDRLKPSGYGSALYCLYQKTGNCTDFHALFMSLGRSLGIPTQFVMGSYLPKEKEGKEDPAYHCWAKFFDPRRGWVPVDVALGNLWPKEKDFYFGNLDSRRVAFTEGRNVQLAPPQEGPPLNLFIYGYVEVDGKPEGKVQRKLIFKSL